MIFSLARKLILQIFNRNTLSKMQNITIHNWNYSSFKSTRGKYFYLFGDNHHGTDLKFDWFFGKILPFES